MPARTERYVRAGNNGIMERLSELESENLMSRLWEGLWERIMLKVCKVQRLLLTTVKYAPSSHFTWQAFNFLEEWSIGLMLL